MSRMTAVKMNMPAKIDPRSKPCPFCGASAQVEYWHGGGPDKRMISCSDPDGKCEVRPMVSGESLIKARHHWNKRSS